MTLIKYQKKNAEPRWFPSVWENLFDTDFPTLFTNTWNRSMPGINVLETENDYRLELAAPGMTKDDFKLHLAGNLLEISGESKRESKEEEKNYTRREFNYAHFTRSFSLPEGVNTDYINATCKDGILTITLPKTDDAKKNHSREIKIS